MLYKYTIFAIRRQYFPGIINIFIFSCVSDSELRREAATYLVLAAGGDIQVGNRELVLEAKLFGTGKYAVRRDMYA